MPGAAAASGSFRENRLRHFDNDRREFRMAGQETSAGIPAQNRVVIAWSPQRFSFFEQPHCLNDPFVDVVVRPLSA